jgi:LysM repeat protein
MQSEYTRRQICARMASDGSDFVSPAHDKMDCTNPALQKPVAPLPWRYYDFRRRILIVRKGVVEMSRRTGTKVLAVIAALITAFSTTVLGNGTPVAAKPLAQCTRFYTVRRGDTLARVARRFNVPVGRIMTLNNLANVNDVTRGRTLCVRALASVVGPVTTTIVVKAGETLATIARKYGTSVAALRKLNNIRAVKAGQQIVVPLRRVKARGV